MARLARRAARNPDFQKQIIALTPGVDIENALRSIYRYREEREEIIRTPEFMLNDYADLGYVEGDCDDISTLSAAALLVLGQRVRFVAITYTPGRSEFEHVYVEWWNGANWIPFDLTIAPGMTPKSILRMVENI